MHISDGGALRDAPGSGGIQRGYYGAGGCNCAIHSPVDEKGGQPSDPPGSSQVRHVAVSAEFFPILTALSSEAGRSFHSELGGLPLAGSVRKEKREGKKDATFLRLSSSVGFHVEEGVSNFALGRKSRGEASKERNASEDGSSHVCYTFRLC